MEYFSCLMTLVECQGPENPVPVWAGMATLNVQRRFRPRGKDIFEAMALAWPWYVPPWSPLSVITANPPVLGQALRRTSITSVSLVLLTIHLVVSIFPPGFSKSSWNRISVAPLAVFCAGAAGALVGCATACGTA